LKIENSKKKKVSLPSISNEGKQTNNNVNPKHQGPLEASFNIQARDTLDCEMTRIFYSSRLPFHLEKKILTTGMHFLMLPILLISMDMYHQHIIN